MLAQSHSKKEISRNGMDVSWYAQQDRVYFSMSAPTEGWVTIGFNETSTLIEAYLLIGRVVNGKPEIVEHSTIAPGNYKPLLAFGFSSNVRDIACNQSAGKTTLMFSIPIKANNPHQKDLLPELTYYIIMAYSTHDDFQHHSIMRTSTLITL